ncbi:MAG: glycosyltransferase [Lentisphaerae bacterium]|nr:glycosyltransferase [Lentisphaerota bacterium]
MKIFMLWQYYDEYLTRYAEEHEGIVGMGFSEQREALLDDHFAWPGGLSRIMREQGHDVELVIENADWMQIAWAKEHDFVPPSHHLRQRIVFEQIRQFRPDILWIPHLTEYLGKFVAEVRPYCRKVISWVGSPDPAHLDLTGVSDLIVPVSWMLKERHSQFNSVTVAKSGFDVDVLGKLGAVKKTHDLVFIGQVSPYHRQRARLLSLLVNNHTNMEVLPFRLPVGRLPSVSEALRIATWQAVKKGNLREAMNVVRKGCFPTEFEKACSTLARVATPPVFGLAMYRKMAASYATLNINADVVIRRAGNMRMFEAGGVGTCTLTEQWEAESGLFEPETEMLTFSSDNDLLRIVGGMRENQMRLSAIGKAAQTRTLNEYTLAHMFDSIKPVLKL